jgi:hypothetical protein
MRQFYEEYEKTEIGQSLTGQLVNDAFYGISFTHHILVMNKCAEVDERLCGCRRKTLRSALSFARKRTILLSSLR